MVVPVCLWSCRTISVGTYEKKDNMRPAKLLENVIANTPSYTKATYKFSAEYSFGGTSPNSFSGMLRVSRDSLIWISLRSFNIEGFRMLVSADSVKVMDRINNQYYAEDISALEKLVNIDLSYEDLQSILLNEFFCYQSVRDTSKYKPCMDSIYYCLSTISPKRINKVAERIERPNSNYAERHGTVVQTIKIVPGTFKVKDMYLEDLETERAAFVEYDKFTRYEELLFPQIMNIYVESGDFVGVMKFSISDFEIDEELTFPFKIPAKYTKIDLNEKNR